MKTYNIFIKQNEKSNSIEDVVLIKEGFNIFASIFNIFWFLYNKLWLFSFISFCILTLISSIFTTYIYIIFSILFFLLIGFEANNLLLYKFQRENYYFAGFSIGNDRDDAKLKFLDSINKENKEKNKIIY